MLATKPRKGREDVNDTLDIIHRTAIPGISTLSIEGEERQLGIVKNFKDHPKLNAHLSQDISICWTHLNAQELLTTHHHPIESLIIIMSGSGISQGDSHVEFQAGDTLFIPAWNEHGFTGSHPAGFWALSIQFNPIAIFQQANNPLTTYQHRPKSITADNSQELALKKYSRKNYGTLENPIDFERKIPANIKFSWQRLKDGSPIKKPNDHWQRLGVLAAGNFSGTLDNNTSTSFKLIAGDVFIQPNQEMICHHVNTSTDTAILLIDIAH